MSIKDFSILTKLGEGAYSSVYKVQRLSDGIQYAMKKVKLGSLSQKQLENALNQVRILASIKCQNIIGYKDAFLQGKNLCIIMEFADDGDLYQKIVQYKKKKKLFQENQIWSVLIQITKALKTLHDMNIFHRDLKSANVFLAANGLAKLGDMNVSKLAKNGLLYTQTGTPYYASPEVWKDQPYDSHSDIWSLGCVIYEMTTLQPPFKAEDMQGLFKAVTEGTYSPISNIYSKQLAGVLRMMLQLKPSNRPSTDKLLKSSLLSRKAAQLNLQININQNNQAQLLKTIRIPKKLHYLTDRLPKSNYQVLKTVQDYVYPNQSVKKNLNNLSSKQQRKSTLPRLDGILRYHQDLITKKQSKRSKQKNVNSILLVQGRSKLIGQIRNIDDQLHREIRKNARYKKDAESRHSNSKILPPIKY